MSTSKKLFGFAALVALVLAVWLWFSGQQDAGIFVGLWVPSLLTLGLFVRR